MVTVEIYQRPLNTHVRCYVLIGHGHFLTKQAADYSTSAADNMSCSPVTTQIHTEGFILGLCYGAPRREGCYFAWFQVSCAILGHYAASNLPTFRATFWTHLHGSQDNPEESSWQLAADISGEHTGTDRLARNVDDQLPSQAVQLARSHGNLKCRTIQYTLAMWNAPV